MKVDGSKSLGSYICGQFSIVRLSNHLQYTNLIPDRLEVFGLLDTLNQIVFTAFHLDDMCGLVGQDTDLFVAFLTVSTLLDHCHDDVFGSHEWQFLVDATLNDLGIDNKSFRDVLQQSQKDISSQECFRQGNSTNSAVIQSTFQPLNGAGLQGIVDKHHEVAGERADTLAAHRVTLVSHGGTANLILFERFLDFLQVGQETNIGSHLVAGSTEASQGVKNVNVDLTRVSLTADRVRFCETREFCHELIQLLDLINCIIGYDFYLEYDLILFTFSWSPLKRAMNEAWVPVVPFTPRSLRSLRARSKLRRSHKSS